jgi:hypothetical protein
LVPWSSFVVADAAWLFFFAQEKDRKEETKHTMNHYSDNRSVGIYPSQARIRSVYSNQNMNHRARDQQID